MDLMKLIAWGSIAALIVAILIFSSDGHKQEIWNVVKKLKRNKYKRNRK